MGYELNQVVTYPRTVILDQSYEEFKKLSNIPMRAVIRESYSDVLKIDLRNDDWSDLHVTLTKDDLRKYLHALSLFDLPAINYSINNDTSTVSVWLGGLMIYLADLTKLTNLPSDEKIYDTGDITTDLVANSVAVLKKEVIKNWERFKVLVKSKDLGGKVMIETPGATDHISEILDDLNQLLLYFSNPGNLTEPYTSKILVTGHYEVVDQGQPSERNVFVFEKAYYLPGHEVVYVGTTDEGGTNIVAIQNIKPDPTGNIVVDMLKICDSNEMELSISYDKDYVDAMDGAVLPRFYDGTTLYSNDLLTYNQVAIMFGYITADAYKLQ